MCESSGGGTVPPREAWEVEGMDSSENATLCLGSLAAERMSHARNLDLQ